MNKGEVSIILKRFPVFEPSYVKSIHKKVNSDVVLAIPYGKKFYAWFSYYKSQHVCFILEIGRNNSIDKMYIRPACFHPNLAKNTVLYGTYIENRFFFIENIYFYKNTNVAFYPFYKKLNLINEIFKHELKQNAFTSKDVIFGLPIMKATFYDLISVIPHLNYKIYCIQFRNLNQVHNSFNLVYKNNSISKCFFHVKPSIQSDIYELYCLNNGNIEFYSYAIIPDYKTSVMMNEIFRNIKENQNLDALEESDSEEEFENTNKDKYVNTTIYKIMECSFNPTHKKWVPTRISPNKDISSKEIIHKAEKYNI